MHYHAHQYHGSSDAVEHRPSAKSHYNVLYSGELSTKRQRRLRTHTDLLIAVLQTFIHHKIYTLLYSLTHIL